MTNKKLEKLSLEDLKNVNGGQIFYTKRGNKTEYFVPWAAENDVNFYERAWDAKIRAKDLGIRPNFVECGTVWSALCAAKTQSSHLNAIDRVRSFVG